MDVFEAMAARYSYRDAFTSQPVPREHLRRIIEAGLQAPSGKNQQTTKVVAVDDPETVREIVAIMPLNRALQTAPAMICCIFARDPQPSYEHYSFEVEDCAALVENLLLAITALGYASVWTDGALRLEGRAAKLGRLLGVPDDQVVRILLPVGVPVAPGPRRDKKPFAERAWFNRWGAAE